MKDLEARKRALAAESEVYRQTLKLEIQNLRLCGIRAKRKFSFFGALNPLLTLGGPLAGAMLGGKGRGPLFRCIKSAVVGWQLYRKLGPLIEAFFPTRTRQQTSAETRAESRSPASNV